MKKILAIILCLFGIQIYTYSQTAEPTSPKAEIGISAGSWFSGDVEVDGTNVEKEGGMTLRAFADYYLAPKIAMGVFVGLIPTVEIGGEKATGVEMGISIKPRIKLGDKFVIKPALYIAQRRLNPETEGIESFKGLAIDLAAELQYYVNDKLIIFAKPGFYSQPVGGNGDLDLTWSPIGFINVGVAVPFK